MGPSGVYRPRLRAQAVRYGRLAFLSSGECEGGQAASTPRASSTLRGDVSSRLGGAMTYKDVDFGSRRIYSSRRLQFTVLLHRQFTIAAYRLFCCVKPKAKLYCIMTNGQSASLAWCQAPISDPRPILLLLFLSSLDSFRFVVVRRPL
jgi:hypothetical protein